MNFAFCREEKGAKKRLKKITKINLAAHHWSELVNLNQPGVCEPGVTEDFPMEDIKESLLSGVKLDLPILPSHSQSVERAVKLTSEASYQVYGVDSRHKHIMTKVLSRKLRPAFISKGHYDQCYNDIF